MTKSLPPGRRCGLDHDHALWCSLPSELYPTRHKRAWYNAAAAIVVSTLMVLVSFHATYYSPACS